MEYCLLWRNIPMFKSQPNLYGRISWLSGLSGQTIFCWSSQSVTVFITLHVIYLTLLSIASYNYHPLGAIFCGSASCPRTFGHGLGSSLRPSRWRTTALLPLLQLRYKVPTVPQKQNFVFFYQTFHKLSVKGFLLCIRTCQKSAIWAYFTFKRYGRGEFWPPDYF